MDGSPHKIMKSRQFVKIWIEGSYFRFYYAIAVSIEGRVKLDPSFYRDDVWLLAFIMATS